MSWNGLRPSTSASARPSSRLRAVLIGLTGVCFVTSPSAVRQTETLDRILAVVAGNVIMLSDVRAFIDLGLVQVGVEADPEAVTLEHLIDRQLILDEVDRYVVAEPPAAAVDRRLAAVRARFATAEAFATTLEVVGLTEADLRQVLRDDLRHDAYLHDRFAVAARLTDSELRDYFEDNRDEFVRDGRQLSFIEAGPEIRERLGERLLTQIVADWTATLERRGDVLRVPATRDGGR